MNLPKSNVKNSKTIRVGDTTITVKNGYLLAVEITFTWYSSFGFTIKDGKKVILERTLTQPTKFIRVFRKPLLITPTLIISKTDHTRRRSSFIGSSLTDINIYETVLKQDIRDKNFEIIKDPYYRESADIATSEDELKQIYYEGIINNHPYLKHIALKKLEALKQKQNSNPRFDWAILNTTNSYLSS